MKHVRDLYFHMHVTKQIHSSMNLTMAIAITLIGQALILSVSKLVVQVANDILILQFLVVIVTTHGPVFLFLFTCSFFFISLICFLINSNVLIKFINNFTPIKKTRYYPLQID